MSGVGFPPAYQLPGELGPNLAITALALASLREAQSSGRPLAPTTAASVLLLRRLEEESVIKIPPGSNVRRNPATTVSQLRVSLESNAPLRRMSFENLLADASALRVVLGIWPALIVEEAVAYLRWCLAYSGCSPRSARLAVSLLRRTIIHYPLRSWRKASWIVTRTSGKHELSVATRLTTLLNGALMTLDSARADSIVDPPQDEDTSALSWVVMHYGAKLGTSLYTGGVRFQSMPD